MAAVCSHFHTTLCSHQRCCKRRSVDCWKCDSSLLNTQHFAHTSGGLSSLHSAASGTFFSSFFPQTETARPSFFFSFFFLSLIAFTTSLVKTFSYIIQLSVSCGFSRSSSFCNIQRTRVLLYCKDDAISAENILRSILVPLLMQID